MSVPRSVSPGPVRTEQHPRRAVVAAGVATLLVGGVLSATPASAAAPVFPDNLVVFPDRDFVTVEGFQDHVGEIATLQVIRGSTVVGSARTAVEAGDVAFEVNHPGGACWGKGTGLQVTPDIVAGDVVTISFPDGTSADTTVQDASVTGDAVLSGSTVLVTGVLGSGVDRGRLEQRLVNPDLVPLVGKRDVRALPGAVTPASGGAYSSGLDIAADGTFTATYVFSSAAAAQTAAASGGERLMSWQLEDADGNRQGLSIAEHGELGGPGMGGCPAGPAAQAAPAGSFSAVRSTTDTTQAQVNWTPRASAGCRCRHRLRRGRHRPCRSRRPVRPRRCPDVGERHTDHDHRARCRQHLLVRGPVHGRCPHERTVHQGGGARREHAAR